MAFNKKGEWILDPDKALIDPNNAFPSRKKFAQSLARQIEDLPLTESLIIGINGSWGSGKTTVWNLAKANLPDSEIDILEFNPWRILDEESLIRTFFFEIGSKIVHIDSVDSKIKERARLWDLMAKACGLAGHLVTATEIAATPFAPGVAQVGGWSLKQAISGIQEACKTASDALTQKVSDVLNLDEVRTKLIKTLKDSGSQKRILVVVDDLDRLPDKDIYLVMRMIKAVAALPRVHFLLLYDRPQVEAALGRECSYDGTKYLAKIVQLEKTLPFVSSVDLLAMVQETIFSIKSPIDLKSDAQMLRMRELYRGAWNKVLKTPRDWNRFANAFCSNWDWSKESAQAELNPVDVIGLELLRIAAPKLYSVLPHEKETVLFEDIALRMSEDKTKLKEKFNQLLVLADEPHRKVTDFLMRFLFPYESESYLRTARAQLRVCHPDLFYRYFHLDTDPDIITESELESILRVSHMRDSCLQLLSKFNTRPKFLNFLERLLSDEKSLKRIGFPGMFIAAVMEAADHSPEKPDQFMFFSLSGVSLGADLADELIRLTPKDDVERALTIAFSDTGSRVAITYWLAKNDRKLKKPAETAPILTKELVVTLLEILKNKWQEWHRNPDWFHNIGDEFRYFYWAWTNWGEKDQITRLTRELLKKDEGVLMILHALCLGSKSGQEVWYRLYTKDVEKVLPFKEFAKSVERAGAFLQESKNVGYWEAFTHVDQRKEDDSV